MHIVRTGESAFLGLHTAVAEWLSKRDADERAAELKRIFPYAYTNGLSQNQHAPVNVTIVRARAKHVHYEVPYTPYHNTN